MYAIVDIAGQQFKVRKNQKVCVHRLDASEGSKMEFDKVLLLERDGKVQVGTPLIDGARVAATVLNHLKGDKVLVFKHKRRKGFKKLNGHRQFLTELLIQGILGKGESLKAEEEVVKKKKAAKVKEADEAVSEEAAVVAETSAVKKTVKKKTTSKKTEAKEKE